MLKRRYLLQVIAIFVVGTGALHAAQEKTISSGSTQETELLDHHTQTSSASAHDAILTHHPKEIVTNSPVPKGKDIKGTPTNAVTGPEQVTIGIYFFNIRDVSTGRGTFTSDFCIWSQSSSPGNILGELQFANAERVIWSVEGKPEVSGLNCIKRSGTGVFRMSWNFKKYPHDIQTLRVPIVYTLKDDSKVALVPDQAGSGISKSNIPSGWKFDGFSMEPTKLKVESNLGDPNLGTGHGEFSGIETNIKIERVDPSEYWMMTLIAYATAFMFIISFFIDCTNTSRLGILGAGFIACVISLRTSLAVIGVFGTSVDWLHLVVMGYITFAVICTAVLSYLSHHNVPAKSVRNISMIIGLLTAVSFFWVVWTMYPGIQH